MRVAIVSDVHANLPAFEAVLDQARRSRATEIVVLGDLIGDGPHPKEVLDLARKRGVTVLAGTYELAVARGMRVPPPVAKRDPDRADAFHARAEWTARQLTTRDLAWLKHLAPARRVRWGGTHVVLAHGSPWGPWERIGPEWPDARLAERVAAAKGDVLVTGATHRAEVRALPGGQWYVNPGSAGRPDPGPEATMVLADVEAGSFTVHAVPFDRDQWMRDDLKAKGSYDIVGDTITHSSDGA